jgi:hypothetical protein
MPYRLSSRAEQDLDEVWLSLFTEEVAETDGTGRRMVIHSRA